MPDARTVSTPESKGDTRGFSKADSGETTSRKTASRKTASGETVSRGPVPDGSVLIGRENRPLPNLPRTSKHLRKLLLKIAEDWEASVSIQGKKQKAIQVGSRQISLEDGSNHYLKATWEGGDATLPKTKARQVFRSLLSNEAGLLRAAGFGHVYHRKSGEQVAEVIQKENVAVPVEDASTKGGKKEQGCFEITREGVRSKWDGTHRVLRRSKDVWIELTAIGKELMADLRTWEMAKTEGVPLPLAKKNESLPSSYLTSKDRRDPGRYRTRGLKIGTVDGEVYHAKKSLIVKGPPPEMEEKHSEDDGIAETLQKTRVLKGSLWGQSARPAEYLVSKRAGGTIREKKIRLENGMEVGAREALYVQDRFPDGIWTTGRYKDTITKALSEEKKEVDQLYPVVVGKEGKILASLARYKGDDFRW